MELVIQIQVATIAAVIFAAGVLYNKVNNLEKELKKHEDHAERLTRVETLLKSKN